MSKLVTATKRILVGRPFRSDRLRPTLLPRRAALPVFGSDPLSSVAYAPEQMLLMLSVAGLSYVLSPLIGLAVVFVLLVVVAGYRQIVHAYPSGGGDYEVATINHGHRWGLVVGSALLVDYAFTVAVSISAAVAHLGSLVPLVADHRVVFAVGGIAALTAMNLRGVRESSPAFVIVAYAFVAGIILTICWGLVRTYLLGDELRAESAGFEVTGAPGLAGIGLAFMVLRTFASGCATLTGVQAISNSVPAFRKPKARNAAATLLMMGAIAVVMFLGLLALARITGVVIADDAAKLAGAPDGYRQKTLVAQVSDAVFGGFSVGVYGVVLITGVVLFAAANTAFNGFPVLSSILAQDRFMPRSLHTRGDRLAFSNGVLFLAGFAAALVVAFGAEPSRLIQLYIVGVFVSIVLGQSGMAAHWRRLLRYERDYRVRRRMRRSLWINGFGFAVTGAVLIVIVVTKFTNGAWIAIVMMAVIYAVMTGIRRHYDRVAAELAAPATEQLLPARNHAIVLVATLHLPTRRALAYAKATRPDVLEAVTVNVDDADTRTLVRSWDQHGIQVPLKVIDSPYREITKPVLDYVKRIRRTSPRDVVTVFIPEYVVGHWWEQLLHNQSALRLKTRLLFTSGVMVTSVPWQLRSSAAVRDRQVVVPGAVRRGLDQEPPPRPDPDRDQHRDSHPQ